MPRSPGSRPTLSTVAAQAGVSRQTVSNALNNPELLREDTLEKVLAVIREVGYKPNRAARQLRTRNSHLIGLRTSAEDSALLDRFLHTLVETTEERGYHVLLFAGDADDISDGYEDVMQDTDVDAFVITDTYAGTPQTDLLTAAGVPFVTFGRPWHEDAADHPWVDIDGAYGVELATQHLLEQGHWTVGWLGWQEMCPIGEHRRQGWETAMTRAGASGPALLVPDRLEDAIPGARRLLDQGATAIACATDTLAVGVLHACAERGLVPGRDIGITGFDDSLVAQLAWPGLTSVRQPLEDVAREIIELLGAALAGEEIEQKARMLKPELVERASSLRG